jgi:outer membrane biosynthesis protein TonB
MKISVLAVAVGVLMTLAINGLEVAAFVTFEPEHAVLKGRSGSQRHRLDPIAYGWCGTRRCGAQEARNQRREPEPPPPEEVEILEATLAPELGMATQDPKQLPKLQTHEQEKILEELINFEDPKQKLEEELKHDFDPREAKKVEDKPLDTRLTDILDDDPRKTPTKLEEMLGSADGEVGGQGDVTKQGNAYSRKVAKAIMKEFRVPPHIEDDELPQLYVKVMVVRLALDGDVKEYKVKRRSGNRSFDDAAEAAILKFVSEEGGKEELPPPDPAILGWINSSGMLITLHGQYASKW